MIPYADSEDPDQPARMRSLIRAFAVRIYSEGTFSHGTAEASIGFRAVRISQKTYFRMLYISF